MAFNRREGDFKREKPNFIYGIHSIIEAIEAGCMIFGENYLKEAILGIEVLQIMFFQKMKL
jgi:hypothetical protein